MNLLDLSKIDIKDLQKLDYKKILLDFQKQPATLVALGILVVSLIFCFNYYGKKSAEIRRLQIKLSETRQKALVVEGYNTAKKELEEYLTHKPKKITEEQLINFVANLAEQQNIRITSFSPSNSQPSGIFTVVSLALNLNAPDYANMIMFIRRLEHSDYAIRVDNWAGGSGGGRRGQANQSPENQINASLTITAVNLNE